MEMASYREFGLQPEDLGDPVLPQAAFGVAVWATSPGAELDRVQAAPLTGMGNGYKLWSAGNLSQLEIIVMEILERVWEILSGFFGSLLRGFERGITGVFGSSNARYVKKLHSKVDAITDWEPKLEKLTDAELAGQTDKFRERLAAGETLDDILIEAFATVREAGKRFLGLRHYDVQMIGGIVLHSGNVAEMVTGEGKTLVATLPTYLNALEGKGAHVVTVNDYLARRDMEWMGPLYMELGLTVGAIQSNMSPSERQQAYACDIVYGTNNEFGFDYLRDNMRPAARDDERFPPRYRQAQGPLHFAIIDEVDNILIDEARTPLIISGPAHQDPRRYAEADRIARSLKKDLHFTVSEKDHTATLTDEGVREAEKMAGVESFYTAGNMDWPHLIDNALKAHNLYNRDVNYVIKDGTIVIVDEFTGRLMEGRQWSDGLHQAVEAKEGVKIKEETQTLATITLQNYFKLYDKICGMTGTAMTEANEFWKIYQLDVIAVPTNKEMHRTEYPDTIYAREQFKWRAVADEIENYARWDTAYLNNDEIIAGTLKSENDNEVILADKNNGQKHAIARSDIREFQRAGRPILVGTVSIEKSELLSHLLDQRGVKHEVLNAKNHKREAEIVAQAGRFGAVTIATNMAGRGTDIILGGNPENMAWAQLQDKYATRLDVPREEWDELVHKIDQEYGMSQQRERVKQLGGLHVIGTERHDARRIDLQLRGRCGRQGDPGSSRFYLSLDDDLMRIFAGPFVKRILEMGGFKDDVPLTSSMVSRRIDSAQKKREEYNFEIRKNLLEYDEVMDEQRKRIYKYRQRILDGINCRDLIVDMIRSEIGLRLTSLLNEDFGTESFAAFASSKLATNLEAKAFRKMDYKEAEEVALDEAERNAEGEILSKIDENLPEEEDEADWNWEALVRFANSNWNLNVRDRDLKKIGRDRIDEFLIDRAREAIRKTDLSEGQPLLEPHYNLTVASQWVKAKFGIDVSVEELAGYDEPEQINQLVIERAVAKYDEKEAEYPVMAGMYRFASHGQGPPRVDREGLIAWASSRFDAEVSLDDLKHKQRDEIHQLLLHHSKKHQSLAQQAMQQLQEKVNALSGGREAPLRSGNGAVSSLSEWLKSHADRDIDLRELSDLEEDELRSRLGSIVADHYHPEMRRMERMVLLDVVDSAWKDHLLAMDYLLSAVRQRGMAQLDPKVEYKREGMRMFEGLWQTINERVTDLIFRMEHLNEDFVSNTFVETNAVHQEASTSAQMADQQDTVDGSGGEQKVATIRNRSEKIGRNDPCPCGSGAKYKKCCLRKDRIV